MGRRRSTNLHLPQRMYLNHGAYFYVTRENKWIPLGKDLDKAKIKWCELDGGEPPTGMTALIHRYMIEVAPLKAPRTYADNKTESIKLLAVFGKMNPQDIKPHHVAKYLDLRGKDAPVRANREKALLSHVFTMGMRWGVVDFNPCKGVHRNKEGKRDRYITDDEFKEVWSKANLTIRCLMDIAYLTAQRIGDLLSIGMRDITKDGILIDQNKTGKKILIGMNADLQAAIDRCRRIHPTVKGMTLFHTRSGKQYTYDSFDSMWQRAKKKTGIKDFHFHDIRAKALTDAKRLGLDAQMLAGHATEAMTAHYVKRREIDLIEALKMPNILKNGTEV
jgi:integrase